MSFLDFYKDGPYWDEWGRKVDAIWAEYDAARLKTYLAFYEKQTGIRPKAGDTIEMLGTGPMTVPSTGEDGS
jgi:hypothetical protein